MFLLAHCQLSDNSQICHIERTKDIVVIESIDPPEPSHRQGGIGRIVFLKIASRLLHYLFAHNLLVDFHWSSSSRLTWIKQIEGVSESYLESLLVTIYFFLLNMLMCWTAVSSCKMLTRSSALRPSWSVVSWANLKTPPPAVYMADMC